MIALQQLGKEYEDCTDGGVKTDLPAEDEQRVTEIDKLIGIRCTQHNEHLFNSRLLSSRTMPAVLRYTGVAYDALDAAGTTTGIPLPPEAINHLAIGSALFGIIHATDLIPHYRLSATSKLPVRGKPATMRSLWTKPVTGDTILEAIEAWQENVGDDSAGIIDLRSGGYRNLGKIPTAVTLRVESQSPDGSRKVVSHFNKHYKGLVARELSLQDLQLPADPSATGILAEQFAHAIGAIPAFTEQGFYTKIQSPTEVTLIVPTE